MISYLPLRSETFSSELHKILEISSASSFLKQVSFKIKTENALGCQFRDINLQPGKGGKQSHTTHISLHMNITVHCTEHSAVLQFKCYHFSQITII